MIKLLYNTLFQYIKFIKIKFRSFHESKVVQQQLHKWKQNIALQTDYYMIKAYCKHLSISATITQQSCNCCTNRRFVYPCSTWCAINFWSCNSALVVRYFVSFHKDVVAWLLLDCCATSLLGTKFLKRNLEAIPYWCWKKKLLKAV